MCYNNEQIGVDVMPNIITHKLFAEDVLKQIQIYDIKNIMEQHTQSFYIGSSGPDFLFFSHLKPWEAYKSHALNRLGSQMHTTHINDFYEVAIQQIQQQNKAAVKTEMMAYVFGHICHWALDQAAHPYIFYRTGNCKGISAGYHHRFESMLDTYMLDKIKHMNIKAYPCYEMCEFTEEILKAIARIYVPIARNVYHMDVKVHDIKETLHSWYDIQKYLYDPNNVKYPILKALEKAFKKPWAITGNIIKTNIDDRYDVVNEKHLLWKHPCDDTITSTESFIDLYDKAIPIAVSLIEQTYSCVESAANIKKVLSILQNKTYTTGMEPDHIMKYFDIIYE